MIQVFQGPKDKSNPIPPSLLHSVLEADEQQDEAEEEGTKLILLKDTGVIF